MHPILLYLLKMLVCSGVLYGYYRLALYNARFHQWNRFYLLAALLLSIVAPFVSVPVATQNQPVGMLFIIDTVPTVITRQTAHWFTANNILRLTWWVVSALLALRLLLGLYRSIYVPYRRGDVSHHTDFSVVLTEEQAAPYSFFKWLFWRHDMSPESREGAHVLAHELAHIRQRHSADKLFCEAVLLVFWCNPFFWLIRREMYMIHEFLADRQAIRDHDGAAFAAMILQTLPTAIPGPVANPFFSSQIKRRLRMITQSKKPQFSYLRRISGLVALVVVSTVLTLTAEHSQAQQSTPPPPAIQATGKAAPATLPDSIVSVQILKKNNASKVVYTLKDGSQKEFTPQEALKIGYPVPPLPGMEVKEVQLSIKSNDPTVPDPLYVYAGLVISKEQMQMIPPENIESISVLKGAKAAEAYGEKGKHGVVLITPKNMDFSQQTKVKSVPQEVIVHGYASRPNPEAYIKVTGIKEGDLPDNVLYILNGKVSTKEAVKEINPETIASVNVLKGAVAIEKYGSKAAEGALEINTKGPSFDKVFTKTEQMPSFPGGQEAWTKYLQKQLRYPDQAIDSGTHGIVVVQFIVDESGNISDVELLTDPGNGLGEEAMRLIKRGPKWEPAIQNGRAVKARAQQVVTFRLE